MSSDLTTLNTALLPRSRLSLAALLLVCTLAGCAGYSEFRSGQQLLEQKQPVEGLQKLQEAIRLRPDSLEYRQAYQVARDRTFSTWLRQADRATRNQQYDEARKTYQRMLELDPDTESARLGLQQLGLREQSADLLRQALIARDAGDWAKVRKLTESALAQIPDLTEAIALRLLAEQKLTPPSNEEALAAIFRKSVSLEFREAPLRQIFDALARSSGLNFVFDKDLNKPDLKGTITLRDGSIETAIQLLLASNQLDMQVVNANTLLIYPSSQAKTRDYQELNLRVFPLAYADAKTVAAAVKTLFKGREIVIDEKQNTLTVRETPAAIRVIEKLVYLYDVPESEVMLELEILEISRNKLLDLGVQWPDGLQLTPLPSAGNDNLTLDDLKRLNSNGIGAQLGSMNFRINKTDENVNTLANPRIRVINREKAKVMIGDRVPVITVTNIPNIGVAENVTYLDVGLKLEVEPTIYRGSDISIKIGMEVSNIIGSQTSKLGTVAYTLGSRAASTVLRLRDGETQVLAGLISDEDRDTAQKIPGLGDLPLAGRLFGSNRSQGRKSEIVLSITPRLVRQHVARDLRELEFPSGPESRIKQGGSTSESSSAPRLPEPAAKTAPAQPIATQPAAPLPSTANAE